MKPMKLVQSKLVSSLEYLNMILKDNNLYIIAIHKMEDGYLNVFFVDLDVKLRR